MKLNEISHAFISASQALSLVDPVLRESSVWEPSPLFKWMKMLSKHVYSELESRHVHLPFPLLSSISRMMFECPDSTSHKPETNKRKILSCWTRREETHADGRTVGSRLRFHDHPRGSTRAPDAPLPRLVYFQSRPTPPAHSRTGARNPLGRERDAQNARIRGKEITASRDARPDVRQLLRGTGRRAIFVASWRPNELIGLHA